MSKALSLPSSVGSQEAGLARQLDRGIQHAEGVRVLDAQVDVALRRADRDARDRHALDQRERVAFHQHAVGVGARVALVGIAGDVLLAGRLAQHGLPLDAGREGRAAAAAQARFQHFVDRRVGPELERAREAQVAAGGAVGREVERIDAADACEGQALLRREPGMLLDRPDRGARAPRLSAVPSPPGPARRARSPGRRRCARQAFRPRPAARASRGRASRCGGSRLSRPPPALRACSLRTTASAPSASAPASRGIQTVTLMTSPARPRR